MNILFKYFVLLFLVFGLSQNIVHAQYSENDVNLLSGNYHYTVPLLEVPYSGGSYPVNITCNSGVVMDQISGMIGLGWDFGVGSISRSVNGYPDDWKNKRVYDICVNNTNGTNTSVTSSYSYTNYPTVFNSYLFKYIARPQKNSSKEYINVAGPLYFESVRTGPGNSCNTGYSGLLPNINTLGSDLVRASIQANNYLMDTKWAPSYKGDFIPAYTTYLIDPFDQNSAIMPDYDSYNVSAAGLSGAISPKILEYIGLTNENNYKIGQNPLDSSYKLYTTGPGDNQTKPTSQLYFYFNHEGSSSAKINIGKWAKTADPYPANPLSSFYNEPLQTSEANFFGPVYNSTTNRKGCKKYIEYFTNKDIIENINNCINRGFVESSDIIDRSDANMYDYDGIGAFTITDENGVTYHFSLPVYQFEEVIRDNYSKPVDNITHNYSIEHQNLNKFAYTWLLTSITGPDYVDSNNDNLVNSGDKGYWVKFSYGKWTDGYVWRSPYVNGTSYDYNLTLSEQNNYTHHQVTWGRKQIYYLNTIQTNTHTALFIKSVKKDDLGCTGGQIDNSFSKSINEKIDYCDGFVNPNNDNAPYASPNGNNTFGIINYSTVFTMPERHKLLKLDKIILVKNEDMSSISMTNASGYTLLSPVQATISVSCQITNNGPVANRNYSKTFTCYNQNNVYDSKDLETSDIISKAIQVIEFKQGYYLCYSTPNSEASATEPNNPPNPDNFSNGKLSLFQIHFQGLGGNTIMPCYEFGYVKHTNTYNFNRQDYWGYDCGDPANKTDDNNNKSTYVDNWSINKIVAPIGSEMNITYKSDVYNLEAANLNPVINVNPRYGGGLTVDEIQIKDENNNIFKSRYTFSDGVTIYSPDGINNKSFLYLNFLPLPGVMYKNVSVENLNAAGERLSKTLYEYKVPDKLMWSNPPTTISYNFSMNCFSMIQNPVNPEPNNPQVTWYEGLQRIFTRNVIMVDYSSTIGRIEKITYKLGPYNDKIITYHYLDNNPLPLAGQAEIGRVKETFKNRKLHWLPNAPVGDPKYDWHLTTSSIEAIPNVLESISTFNMGTETWLYYDLSKYDYNIGRCMETNTEKQNNYQRLDNVRTKTIMAYTKYPAMGSKVIDITNKNMLSSECAFYNYAFDMGNFTVTGASVNTWSNTWKSRVFNNSNSQPRYVDLLASGNNWISNANYIWKGNVVHGSGFYDASFAEFNFNDIPASMTNGWIKEKEITRIDNFSNPIETKDLGKIYNSVKNDNNDNTLYSIASCSGASFKNFAYTGFETKTNKYLLSWLNEFGSEVLGNQQNTNIVPLSGETIQPHTGNAYLKTTAEWGPGFQILWLDADGDGIGDPDGLQLGKTYRASVWVNVNSNSKVLLVSDLVGQTRTWNSVSASNSLIQIGNWKLLTIEVTVPANILPDNNNEISLNFYIWNTLNSTPTTPALVAPYLVSETIPYSNASNFAYIDDFVVAPVDAIIQGSAMDSRTGWILGSTNNNGYGIKFEYDNAGRLLILKKETKNGFVKTVEKQYHFGREQ